MSLLIHVRNGDLWPTSTIEIMDMISGYSWISCPCFKKSTSSLDSVYNNYCHNVSQNLLSRNLQRHVHHLDDNSVDFQFWQLLSWYSITDSKSLDQLRQIHSFIMRLIVSMPLHTFPTLIYFMTIPQGFQLGDGGKACTSQKGQSTLYLQFKFCLCFEH